MNTSNVDKCAIVISLVVIGSMLGVAFYKSPKIEVLRESSPTTTTEIPSQQLFPTITTMPDTQQDFSKLDLIKHYSLPVYVGKFTTDGLINSFGIQGDGDKVTNLEGKDYITLTINIPEKTVYQMFTTEGAEGNVYGYANSIVILEKGKEYIVIKVIEE
jgi:hypothetical protein